MAFMYDVDGDVNPLPGQNDIFFRKMTNYLSHTERRIAKMLLDKPQDNVVTIYAVEDKYTDMELLDVTHPMEDMVAIERDIRQAVEQLHSLGIIYVDLKLDNIGYSDENKCWKLFDFDASGIVENNQWVHKPPEWFLYRQALSINPKMTNLFDIDRILLDLLFEKKVI